MRKFGQYHDIIFHPACGFEQKFMYLQAVKMAVNLHPKIWRPFYDQAVKLIFDELQN